MASPSSTEDGPEIEMVIGSLSAIVAEALEAVVLTHTLSAWSPVSAPSSTLKVSDPSDKLSSVSATVMVCVVELAGKVMDPDEAPRSAATAVSVVADQATVTAAVTAWDRVTVKDAFDPSCTSAVGPVMLKYVESSSLIVMTAELMSRPEELPPTMMVSSPSMSSSSIMVRVRVRVPLPLDSLAGMVTLACAGPV